LINRPVIVKRKSTTPLTRGADRDSGTGVSSPPSPSHDSRRPLQIEKPFPRQLPLNVPGRVFQGPRAALFEVAKPPLCWLSSPHCNALGIARPLAAAPQACDQHRLRYRISVLYPHTTRHAPWALWWQLSVAPPVPTPAVPPTRARCDVRAR